jgi:hypothetical protein
VLRAFGTRDYRFCQIKKPELLLFKFHEKDSISLHGFHNIIYQNGGLSTSAHYKLANPNNLTILEVDDEIGLVNGDTLLCDLFRANCDYGAVGIGIDL